MLEARSPRSRLGERGRRTPHLSSLVSAEENYRPPPLSRVRTAGPGPRPFRNQWPVAKRCFDPLIRQPQNFHGHLVPEGQFNGLVDLLALQNGLLCCFVCQKQTL